MKLKCYSRTQIKQKKLFRLNFCRALETRHMLKLAPVNFFEAANEALRHPEVKDILQRPQVHDTLRHSHQAPHEVKIQLTQAFHGSVLDINITHLLQVGQQQSLEPRKRALGKRQPAPLPPHEDVIEMEVYEARHVREVIQWIFLQSGRP